MSRVIAPPTSAVTAIQEPETALSGEVAQRVTAAVKKVTTIATLPEVTTRIIATVEDPKSNASQLNKIVSHDPALAARILKVVNSAFYGMPGQIGSLDRAIVILGLGAVKNLAVAASVGQLFRGVTLCEGYTAKDLWIHSIAVAATARQIARQMRLPSSEEAFLAGMIHDVGVLVALHVHPEPLREVCERVRKARGGADLCAAEREVCGLDHQQLGQGLAAQWKFTQACQVVAGHHHKLTAQSAHRRLVAIVHAADTICADRGYGFNLTAIGQRLDGEMMAECMVPMDVIEDVKSKLEETVSGAVAVLG